VRARGSRSPSGEVVPRTGASQSVATFVQSRHVLSREQLLAASRVHRWEVFESPASLCDLSLRRKLEANPVPTLIQDGNAAGLPYGCSREVRCGPRRVSTGAKTSDVTCAGKRCRASRPRYS